MVQLRYCRSIANVLTFFSYWYWQNNCWCFTQYMFY